MITYRRIPTAGQYFYPRLNWVERRVKIVNSLWSLWGLSGFRSSFGSFSEPDSVLALRCSFFILARWFWNQTWTTLTLSPVSLARASRTLRHGFGEISNEALNWRLWTDVRIVLGRFGPRLPSRGLLSSRSSSVDTIKRSIYLLIQVLFDEYKSKWKKKQIFIAL